VTASARCLLNIPAAKDLGERIALTLGQDFRSHLLPAGGEKNGMSLRGFVSRPEFTRSSAAQMYFSVNDRFVKDFLLNHAVMTAYRRLIEARRYPAVVLRLELPPGDVDVNVHPAKREVRFRNPGKFTPSSWRRSVRRSEQEYCRGRRVRGVHRIRRRRRMPTGLQRR